MILDLLLIVIVGGLLIVDRMPKRFGPPMSRTWFYIMWAELIWFSIWLVHDVRAHHWW